MSSTMETKRVVFKTDKERILPNDLSGLVLKVGKRNLRQIFSSGDEIIANFNSEFHLESLDNYEGMRFDSGIRIKAVEYEGKKQKILLTIVGLDYDTSDNDVITEMETLVKLAGRTVYRSKYNAGDLKGLCNGKRTCYVHEIPHKQLFGSYLKIAEQKVRIFHNGVTKSCGWCYLPESLCESGANYLECNALKRNRKPDFGH